MHDDLFRVGPLGNQNYLIRNVMECVDTPYSYANTQSFSGVSMPSSAESGTANILPGKMRTNPRKSRSASVK